MNPFDKVTLELNRKITSLEEENAALKEQVAQLGIEFTAYKRATDLAYKGSELETQEQLIALQSKSDALVDALNEISNWLVCSPIASAEDMVQSFPAMFELCEEALAAFKGDSNVKP